MTLRGPGGDSRPPLRPWQQRTLVVLAGVVIVAVLVITLVSGKSFF
ncbi:MULTISPECIES: hypothetical protein [unclassified Rathayibacter]|nr:MULTISPECIES: hypothetical protein [unclassified Rathayibacter]MBF4463606.1 hypothetical protein [Rathayibacter sp. VKM Ac-2879]MBF4504944.1 hypothetical protein [Rathayibacter sp. VKM Ac-2878]